MTYRHNLCVCFLNVRLDEFKFHIRVKYIDQVGKCKQFNYLLSGGLNI